ncbi:MAG TPA: SDR family oxidoreductase [Ilumatobacteraceae bacterium]|nr:SDR family oxidoreductase [Ilumatobacteraceae bacterium]
MTSAQPQGSRLQGRTAIVTGAGQGVGEGIARRLASEGANVVIAARRAETGDPIAASITAVGGRAACVVTDVTDRTSMANCVATTIEMYGSLEIMVHNAFAGARAHRLEEARIDGTFDDDWTAMSRTSVWGSLYSAQAAFEHLRTAGNRGRLILLTSPSGIEGSANIPLYSPAKAAQRAIAKSLAREWGEYGITVNCIAPVAASPALIRVFKEVDGLQAATAARTPLGRVGDITSDIGSVALFLASDDSSYVTGQTIVCDGGSFLGL